MYMPLEKAQPNIQTLSAHVCVSLLISSICHMPYAQPLAQCLAQSRAGVHVCCVKGAVHASHLAVTCQGFATFSSLPDCVCSPKSRAQAPHLFQFLRCVQKTCGGDIRWHPKE